MKIALVHDHLAQDGGAEKVLAAFQQIWPEAPTYVVVYNPKQANKIFANKDIRTSFIQKLPWGVKKYKWYMPFYPAAVEDYDLSDYDVILSSNSAFAKGIITKPKTLHICYCHTPTRFLWSDTHSYIKELGVSKIVKKILPIFLSNIRQWDRLAAERVDKYISNSSLVKKRIEKYYHRDSDIIYPPVEVEKFALNNETGDYFLAGGRIVPYKRFDIIVDAFNRLGRPLKIFGDGPELNALKARAKKNIEFLGRVDDQEKMKLYQNALAYINPQEEDFGITMLESMASGRPVIAYDAGGAKEIINTNLTGILFAEQTWEDLADAVVKFDSATYTPSEIRKYAEQFNISHFKQSIEQYVEQAYQEFNNK
ncbi:MAG: glycosyltransferase [Patescibacteria group bacterium]